MPSSEAIPLHRLAVPRQAPAPEGKRKPEPDPQLVARAQGGDMEAWGELYSLMYSEVFARLCFLTGDTDLARDMTQETFARAVVSLPKFRGDAAFRHWLHRVAFNVAREQWRCRRSGRRLRERLSEAFASHGPRDTDPETMHLDNVRTETLYTVLNTLPPGLRQAFVLRDLLGLSTNEAADEAGVSPNNLAVRAHRARQRIREELTKLGWVAPRGGEL